jgi:serine protease
LVISLVVVFFCSLSCGIAPLRQIDPENSIDNQYLVVFKYNLSSEIRNQHLQKLFLSFLNEDDVFENKFLFNYEIQFFSGFSAILSPNLLKQQLESPNVDFVEQDAVISLEKFGKPVVSSEKQKLQDALKSLASAEISSSCTPENGATWGLDRICKRELDLDENYNYPNVAGAGVTAYVIDTGINVKHKEFQGRAVWGGNFVDSNNNDCNGHGTHVAGTIGSVTFGVAKSVSLSAIKVLNCQGSGSYAGVIEGINFVAQQTKKRSNGASVANLSLGGPKSDTMDKAIDEAVASGVTMVVAGGNDNDDSCKYSPASAPNAITVGATGVDDDTSSMVDLRGSFSNYGECVDIFAPGVLIESTWIGPKNTELRTISGTSMASPHVAGVAALYLSAHPGVTPSEIADWMLSEATQDAIVLNCNAAKNAGICNDSPNLLLYSPCS